MSGNKTSNCITFMRTGLISVAFVRSAGSWPAMVAADPALAAADPALAAAGRLWRRWQIGTYGTESGYPVNPDTGHARPVLHNSVPIFYLEILYAYMYKY